MPFSFRLSMDGLDRKNRFNFSIIDSRVNLTSSISARFFSSPVTAISEPEKAAKISKKRQGNKTTKSLCENISRNCDHSINVKT